MARNPLLTVAFAVAAGCACNHGPSPSDTGDASTSSTGTGTTGSSSTDTTEGTTTDEGTTDTGSSTDTGVSSCLDDPEVAAMMCPTQTECWPDVSPPQGFSCEGMGFGPVGEGDCRCEPVRYGCAGQTGTEYSCCCLPSDLGK